MSKGKTTSSTNTKQNKFTKAPNNDKRLNLMFKVIYVLAATLLVLTYAYMDLKKTSVMSACLAIPFIGIAFSICLNIIVYIVCELMCLQKNGIKYLDKAETLYSNIFESLYYIFFTSLAASLVLFVFPQIRFFLRSNINYTFFICLILALIYIFTFNKKNKISLTIASSSSLLAVYLFLFLVTAL